ncbi:uncharacterized protein RHO25_008700 [Cercospora beticola]|uniref:NTF2 domain-containing protein n=1 Tax=Cercospora beticola TaxID=122368 RepID=A0ABZ0NX44_CERBT|nr:hypothetical protein RHO25_008700 [Cercospora beticola]
MATGNVYEVTKAFIDQNYALWDDQSRRPELKAFYASDSTLSFESAITSFSGGDAIYTGVFVSRACCPWAGRTGVLR